jgi:hypothetical protein
MPEPLHLPGQRITGGVRRPQIVAQLLHGDDHPGQSEQPERDKGSDDEVGPSTRPGR